MTNEQEYIISINPGILKLLGPHLYTNIYYVLAELIANAYDAGASNTYIIQEKDNIIVEDDGIGMSYADTKKYLDVAVETRTNEKESYIEVKGIKRRKMGRKGVGKLAALSVSDKVLVMTKQAKKPLGCILSTHVNKDNKLKPISPDEIYFRETSGASSATSIVMTNPQYSLDSDFNTIKKNLLKIFPLVNKNFIIHLYVSGHKEIISDFDKEMVQGLGGLIILGKKYVHLSKYFNSGLPNKEQREKNLLFKKDAVVHLMKKLKNRYGITKDYELIIEGWIGVYQSTRERKLNQADFPDNFISLISNDKLGDYSILPVVGKNKLSEVYVVGQLNIDLFEETELPDMALSNRQGYKTDDPRYKFVIDYVREYLLPEVVELRTKYASYKFQDKNKNKLEQDKEREKTLRRKTEEFKTKTSEEASKRIGKLLNNKDPRIKEIIDNLLNRNSSLLGLKSKVDAQKKKILICHSGANKTVADVILKMLCFNNIPDEDIIYTSSDNEKSRIPSNTDIFEYLRFFFVDSISKEKIFLIYVTSNEMAQSWNAVSEVGAGWITKKAHNIFSINGFKPQRPLNNSVIYQNTNQNGNNVSMSIKEADIFVIMIMDICTSLGYPIKDKKSNEKELKRYINIT